MAEKSNVKNTGRGCLVWMGRVLLVIVALLALTGLAGAAVCAYDRAGLGWSDLGRSPRSARVVVDELRALLRTAGEPGPYVLVGHSLGGLFVQMYAAAHPEEVAGLVLVDSPHPKHFERAPAKEIETMREIGQVMPLLYGVQTAAAYTGIPALLPGEALPGEGFPEEAGRAYAAQLKGSLRYLRGVAVEMGALEAYYSEVRQAGAGSLGDLPVIVLTHTRPEGYMGFTPEEIAASEQAWLNFQHELAGLSSRGKVVAAEESGHNIMIERPDLVIGAVEEVVSAASRSVAEQ